MSNVVQYSLMAYVGLGDYREDLFATPLVLIVNYLTKLFFL